MRSPRLPTQVTAPQLTLGEQQAHRILGADVVAVPVLAGDGGDDGDAAVPGLGADELGAALGVDVRRVLSAAGGAGGAGKAGAVVSYPVPYGIVENPSLRLLLFVGAGSGRPGELRRAGAAMARAARGRGLLATSVSAGAGSDGLTAFVEGLILASFRFHWRSTAPPDLPVRQVVLAATVDHAAAASALRRAVASGTAGWRARMIATVPANLKDPPWLAEQAQCIAAEADLAVRIWDEPALAAGGFGGILGVGQGSSSPPRLIRLDYRPRRVRKAPTVVLVGKGITFDSGGLSIKPGEAMATMKRDVTGGAVVLATMAALRDVDCAVRVVGLVPAAENAVSGSAMRPGDVIRHVGGRTTEVTNTDAEGRLVLADAMAYAVAELDPAVVVDVATLTGAARVALGQEVAALFATDDVLADRLLRAGEEAGEPLWRLPLFAGYEERLASPVADADNAPSGPGAIIAALFLRSFVGDVPWAHLDLASVGDVPKDRHEWTAGPSGFGARLLLRWLGADAPLAGIGA